MGMLRTLVPDDNERRYQLAARNGALTSALSSHPQPPTLIS